jgi:hypothetical protein
MAAVPGEAVPGARMVLCDDGDGPYLQPYTSLVAELERLHGPARTAHCTHVQVNGTPCAIVCTGGYYCGYVLADVSMAAHVYEPHGGWTADWGFDCAHCTDVVLIARLQQSLAEDEDLSEGLALIGDALMFMRPEASFKTFAFVLKELDRITQSLLVE